MFITFEGIEGSGKSTALTRVCHLLETAGIAFLRTREPGGNELGKHLRALLLDSRQQVSSKAELFLYLADRAQHVSQVIRPALEGGALVLSDRYADSTVVYQGYGRGLNINKLYSFNEEAVDGLWPDLTILFDLPPEVGLARARERNDSNGTSVTEGRFEAEQLDFHTRIREGYLAWAARHHTRFHIVNAQNGPEQVLSDLLEILAVHGLFLQQHPVQGE
ncbi:dTMP kinase [Desulfovibrio sp. OttesenSCG-928-G15]|nr:dTMP kinase [Desulfovibrio sp. OttesenSCG-928-G15]